MSARRGARPTLFGLVLCAVAAAGCGISPQEAPQPIDVSAAERATPRRTANGPATVDVYFLRGARLAPVARRAEAPRAAAVLAVLVAGPSRSEVLSDGLRTSLAPQPFIYQGTERLGGQDVVRVDAAAEFTSVTGADQLLAVAQLVWTLTALPGVEQVLITVEGTPIEVPTDAGLSDQPVDRQDFLSVAPPTQTQTPTPTPTR